MEKDQTQDLESLTTLHIDNTTLYVLGTAHISQKSIDEVHFCAQTYDIDSIAVELDTLRYEKITKADSAFEKLDIFNVIKQKKAMLLISSILLSSFQRRLGQQLNVTPGAEMLAAIEESKTKNIPCALVDRPADVTLKRAWAMSSFWGKQKIFAALLGMIFTKENVSEEQLQELKTSSLQGEMLQELSKFLPELKQVLLDERDEYLALKIIESSQKYKSKAMLVVLGAAHVPGVCKHIEKYNTDSSKLNVEQNTTKDDEKQNMSSTRIDALEFIPNKKASFGTVLKFLIPLGVLSLFVWGFIKGGKDVGTQNILEWYLINGGLSLLGAIIALANPITMLVAFFAAPFTSINPFLGVGLLTGLTEAWMRKPQVKDITELQSINLSIKSVYKNRVLRILFVLLLTTIGSAIGTFVAIPTLFS